MGHAEIDEAGFFDTGDDLDLVAQCLGRATEEVGCVMCPTQGVGSHCPDELGRNVAEAVTETFERAERASLGLLG